MKETKAFGKKVILAVLLLILYIAAVKAWDKRENSVCIVFTEVFPDYEQAAGILKTEEKQEEPASVCFYEGLGWQKIKEKETGKTFTAEAVMLLGEGSLYHPRLKETLLEDDKAVIISSDIAWKLWGSREVQGKEILWKDKTYVVSQVLSEKGSFFLVKGRKELGSFHTVLMGSKGAQSQEREIQNFLMRNALSGERADIRLLRILGRGLLCVIPGGMLVMFLRMLAAEGRNRQSARGIRIGCMGFGILVLAGVSWQVFKNWSWPKEWIPNKWADFSFWGEKYQELKTSMMYYLRTAKTAAQVLELVQIGKTTALSFMAIVIEVWLFGKEAS